MPAALISPISVSLSTTRKRTALTLTQHDDAQEARQRLGELWSRSGVSWSEPTISHTATARLCFSPPRTVHTMVHGLIDRMIKRAIRGKLLSPCSSSLPAFFFPPYASSTELEHHRTHTPSPSSHHVHSTTTVSVSHLCRHARMPHSGVRTLGHHHHSHQLLCQGPTSGFTHLQP